MFDVADIKAHTDLLAIIEADLGPARRKNGRWYSWPCPFHDDSTRDGGSLRVTPDTGTWFCFGCRASGDVIAWIRKRQGLSFGDACRQLNGRSVMRNRSAWPMQSVQPIASPPDRQWQECVGKLADQASAFLWTTGAQSAITYLHQRGLTDQTIRVWGLGYNPVWSFIPDLPETDGKPATLARGITIPVRVQGVLWALKVRQAEGTIPKYVQVAGGKAALFGADTLTKSVALLTEGEFDAMLAWQEAGDFVGVASTTGGAKTWQRDWAVHLLPARTILVAYDTDKTGEEAAASAIASLGSRAKRVTVPKGKDITEFWRAGGDVRAWVMGLLDLPPKPTDSCPVCSNTVWVWRVDRWVCDVCGD